MESSRLVGIADYEFRILGKSLTIDGFVSPDGRFWPVATPEVRINPKAEWKRLEAMLPTGLAATFTAEKNSAKPLLYFDLEVFRPYLSSADCGRLVLANGEAASIRFDDLKALEQQAATSSSHRGITLYRDSLYSGNMPTEFVHPPLLLSAISEIDGNLVGECRYLSNDHGQQLTLPGVKAKDGTLWLKTISQVTNDYRSVWITIGKNDPPGDSVAVMLSDDIRGKWLVDLNPFRSLIGKYRYGRVVLSNGVSAAFELDDLIP